MSTSVSEALLREAVVESASDPSYFCRFFLRRWFKAPLGWAQLGLLAILTRKVSFLDKYPETHSLLIEWFRYQDPSDPAGTRTLPIFSHDSEGRLCMTLAPNTNIVWPRGFSKTTICNAANLYNILTDPEYFGVYISNTLTHAQTQLGNIRHELEENQLIRAAYGNLVPDRSDSERWTAGELQMLNGAILIARGRGSQIRGILFRSRRPKFILLDDVEDEESVSTPEQRKKTSSWFYGGVAPAGNEMDGAEEEDDFQILNLATLLDADALSVQLSKDIEFNTIRLGARLKPGLMLWEYKMREETYLRKRARYQRVGKLAEFCREYDSTIRIGEDALFQHHNVTLYLPIERSLLLDVAIAMDPAISDKPRSSHATIAVVGRGRLRDGAASGLLWVLEAWGGQGKSPRELINKFFDLYILWASEHYNLKAGIEAQGYQAALIHLMREEMARRGRFFNIEPIIQNQDKTQRIKGILQPRYANGYIRHARPFPELEAQLEDFPGGKMDYPDAVAMAMKLIGETAMVAAEGDDLPSIFGNEYPPLDPPPESPYAGGNGNFIFGSLPNPFAGRYGPGS